MAQQLVLMLQQTVSHPGSHSGSSSVAHTQKEDMKTEGDLWKKGLVGGEGGKWG